MFLFTFWLLTVFPLFFSVILPYFLFSPSLPVISLYFFIWSCYFLSLPTLTLFFFLQVLFNPPTLRSSTFCFPLKFPLDQKMSLPSRSFPPPLFEMCVREALSWAFQVTRSLQRSQPLAFLSFSPAPHLCYPSPRLQVFFFFFFLLLTRLLTLKI